MSDFSDDDMSRPPSRAPSTYALCKDEMKFIDWIDCFDFIEIPMEEDEGGQSPKSLARLENLKAVTLPFPPTVSEGHRCYEFYKGIRTNWPVSSVVEDTHDFATNYPYLGLTWNHHCTRTHYSEASFRQFFDNLITTAFEWDEEKVPKAGNRIRVENKYPVPDAPQSRQKEVWGRMDLAWICRIQNEIFRKCRPRGNKNVNPFRNGKDSALTLIIIGFLTEYKLNDLDYVRNQVIVGLMACTLHLRRLGVLDVTIYGLAVDSSGKKELWDATIDVEGHIKLDYADASILDERTPEGALKLYFFMLNMKKHLLDTLLPKFEHLKSEDLKNSEFDWVGPRGDGGDDRGSSRASGSYSGGGTFGDESLGGPDSAGSYNRGTSYPLPFLHSSSTATKRKRDYQDPSSAAEDRDFSDQMLRIPIPTANTLPAWLTSSAEELDSMDVVPKISVASNAVSHSRTFSPP